MTAHSFPALGFDPAPGDVDSTRALARQLGHIATELSTTVREIDTIECGAWKGKAAKAFADHVAHDVEPLLKKAQESFDHSSHALGGWANQLEGFQQEARSLEREAADKKASLSAAQSAAGVTVDGHRPVPAPSPEAAPQSHADAAAAAADAKRKQHALSDASSAFAGVMNRAHDLQDRYNAAAKAAGGKLDKAGDIAPDKPGFFSRMVHDVEDAWNGCAQWLHDHADMIAHIGDVLSAISGVLGVIAIITAPFEPLGAIFAGAAAATSGLALLAHVVAKASGANVSWTSIGFDALGALPGIKGFTMGAKVADEAAAASKVAKFGDGVEATSSTGKKFVLFGGKSTKYAMKGTTFAGKLKAGGAEAMINTQKGQWMGTQGLNTLTKLPFVKATQLIDPMSNLGRGIDSAVKSGSVGYKIGGMLSRDFGVGAGSPAPAH